MKTQPRILTDSNTSSFVVTVYRNESNPIRLITIEQYDLLIEYGFKQASYDYSYQIEAVRGINNRPNNPTLYYYLYGKPQRTIQWLVEHRIPFCASIHSCTETLYYDGKTDTVYSIDNLGILAERYGLETMKKWFPNVIIKEIDYED